MLRLALALALLLPAAAHAEERIRGFDSQVQIARDGHLDVTETIDVASEGREIRRGIQRDFPTSYRDRLGQRTRVGFDVLSVTRDGAAEPPGSVRAALSRPAGSLLWIGHQPP